MQESPKKLSGVLLNSYGLADFTFNLMMMVAVTYYAYFLTDVAMISAATMGTILLMARIFDMVSVPITGGIIQNVQFRWGQFRSWILIAPPFVCLFFILMFTNPNLNPLTKAIFLGVCYAIGHFFVNLAYNSHLAMIGILGQTPEERLMLSQRKIQFQTAANIAFSLTCMPLIEFFGNGSEAKGFLFTIALFSALQVLGYWNLFRVSKGYDVYVPEKNAGKTKTGLSIKEMIEQMFVNGPLMTLFITTTIQNTSMFALSALLTYYYKYVIGNLEMISVHLSANAICSFVGSLVAPIIVRKLKKRRTFIFSTLVSVVIFALIRLSGGANPYIFIAGSSLGALLGASGMSIGPALFSDAAEYGRWKTGKDAKAFIMSMSVMPTKIGVALSGAVVGYGLAIIGYDPMAEPTQILVKSIINLITSIPILCGIIAFLLFALFYKLTDEKVMEIMGISAK